MRASVVRSSDDLRQTSSSLMDVTSDGRSVSGVEWGRLGRLGRLGSGRAEAQRNRDLMR